MGKVKMHRLEFSSTDALNIERNQSSFLKGINHGTYL